MNHSRRRDRALERGVPVVSDMLLNHGIIFLVRRQSEDSAKVIGIHFVEPIVLECPFLVLDCLFPWWRAESTAVATEGKSQTGLGEISMPGEKITQGLVSELVSG